MTTVLIGTFSIAVSVFDDLAAIETDYTSFTLGGFRFSAIRPLRLYPPGFWEYTSTAEEPRPG